MAHFCPSFYRSPLSRPGLGPLAKTCQPSHNKRKAAYVERSSLGSEILLFFLGSVCVPMRKIFPIPLHSHPRLFDRGKSKGVQVIRNILLLSKNAISRNPLYRNCHSYIFVNFHRFTPNPKTLYLLCDANCIAINKKYYTIFCAHCTIPLIGFI